MLKCGQLVFYGRDPKKGWLAIVVENHKKLVHTTEGKSSREVQERLDEELAKNGLYVQPICPAGGILKHK